MSFYERYEELCAERGMKPQNPEMQRVAGVSSGAISGWKKGSDPKIEVLARLSKYFQVTTDYLLGLSSLRNPSTDYPLSDMEQLLVDTFRSVDTVGQANIIHTCLSERDRLENSNPEHTKVKEVAAAAV